LSGALLAAGSSVRAEKAARRAAASFAELGDQIGLAQSLRAVGEALARDPGRVQAAERALRDAAAIFDARGYEWGAALTELSLGELTVRYGGSGAADALRRSLRYWLAEGIPALQARTLAALAAELDGDPASTDLLRAAQRIYADLDVPEARAIAERLGPSLSGPVPDVAALAAGRLSDGHSAVTDDGTPARRRPPSA
jgi:hypothetical protein